MEQKEFPTAVLLSITTGRLLCEKFSLMHEAAEFILGQPIWTSQFASEKVCNALKTQLLDQHPDLLPELGNDIDESNWKEKTAALVEKLGETRVVKKGEYINPFCLSEGLPKDKPTIIFENSLTSYGSSPVSRNSSIRTDN